MASISTQYVNTSRDDIALRVGNNITDAQISIGAFMDNGVVNIGNAANIVNSVHIKSTKDTVLGDITQGALVVNGGVAIKKDLNVDGVILNAGFPIDGRTINNALTTGLVSGGTMSPAGGGDINISDGCGQVADNSDPLAPIFTKVVWTGLVNFAIITPSNIFTHIYITSAGTVLQSLVETTPDLRRDNIYLGKVFTADGVNVNVVSNQPDIVLSGGAQSHDFWKGLGPVVMEGLRAGANGVNLSISISAGILHQSGIGWTVNTNSPNVKSYAAVPLQVTGRSTQLVTDVGPYNFIDNANWDDGGVITLITPASNKATNMRIYFFNSGFVTVHYGQQVYSTITEAIAGIATETFIVENVPLTNGVLVATLSVRAAATDLSLDTDAYFSPASKFGEAAVGAGAVSTSNFQNVYNNSTQPQVILTSALGGLEIRDNATPIAAPLFAVEDNAGTSKYLTVSATNFKSDASGTIDIGNDDISPVNANDYLDINMLAGRSFLKLRNYDATGDASEVTVRANTDCEIKLNSISGSDSIQSTCDTFIIDGDLSANGFSSSINTITMKSLPFRRDTGNAVLIDVFVDGVKWTNASASSTISWDATGGMAFVTIQLSFSATQGIATDKITFDMSAIGTIVGKNRLTLVEGANTSIAVLPSTSEPYIYMNPVTPDLGDLYMFDFTGANVTFMPYPNLNWADATGRLLFTGIVQVGSPAP